jgi:hypothetical protein
MARDAIMRASADCDRPKFVLENQEFNNRGAD